KRLRRIGISKCQLASVRRNQNPKMIRTVYARKKVPPSRPPSANAVRICEWIALPSKSRGSNPNFPPVSTSFCERISRKLSQTSDLLNHDPLPTQGDARNPSHAAVSIADLSTFDRVALPSVSARRTFRVVHGNPTKAIGTHTMNKYLRKSGGKDLERSSPARSRHSI